MIIDLPRGIKTYHRKFQKEFSNGYLEWKQILIQDDAIIGKLVDLTKYKGKNFRADVVLHFCSSSVENHRDDLSKSCYVIPVHCGDGWVLTIEEPHRYREVKIKTGEMVRFNDYHVHGLFRSDHAKSYCIFYTVAFVPTLKGL